uniref:Uncharacterized protein n=1 Tax=Arundo donax TaxID=35708 RepID=A0A0A9A2D4_ARUDO
MVKTLPRGRQQVYIGPSQLLNHCPTFPRKIIAI